jgi:hypothetical protein
MAKRKSKGTNEYNGPFALVSREEEVNRLLEAIEAASSILSAAGWQANDRDLDSEAASEVMRAAEIVLGTGLEAFKRQVNAAMLREVNPPDTRGYRRAFVYDLLGEQRIAESAALAGVVEPVAA